MVAGPTNLSGHSLSAIVKAVTGRVPQYQSTEFTRPADTTAYTAGDVIYPAVPAEGDQIRALTLTNLAVGGGTNLFITNVVLVDFAAETTKLDASLYFFSAPLETAPVDNAAFAPTAVDMANFLGKIDLPQANAEEVGAHTVYQVPGNIVVPTASANLYGVLVANNAYTPVSGEKFQLAIGAMPKDLALF